MKTWVYEKMKNKITNRSGMTLVELIVVFALMGIFMVAATFMLTTSLHLFSRMQSTSQAVTVSDLILDKIVGEIAAADIPAKEEKGGYYFWLESDAGSPWVAFRNRSGSPISIYADSDNDTTNGFGQGQFFMKYYKMSETDKKQLNEINWHFDKQIYMNYQISKLEFSRPDPTAHPNVVKIDLSLTNERTGFTYSSVRYAENYNIDFRTKNMCVRSDGGSGLPKEAEEFKIDSDTNPDNPEKETITYTVEHFLGEDRDPILKELFEVEKGAVDIYAYPKDSSHPDFAGYQSNADKYLVDTQFPGRTYTFIYVPIPPVKWFDYTIRGHVSSEHAGEYPVEDPSGDYSGSGSRSNWELYQETRSAALEVAGTQAASPPWNGYQPANPTYTIVVDQYYKPVVEIPYIPDDITVTIYAKCGDRILDTTVLRGKYESTINLNSKKKIEGYTLTSENYAKILVNQIQGVEYTFYYSQNPANHPYTTVGPNVDVKVNQGEVPPELQKIAENIAGFFNSEWKQVGETGYYKEYFDGDEISVVGGWAGGNQNENSWIAGIMDKEGVTKIEDTLFINKNGSTNEGARKDFLEYIISTSNLGSLENLLDDMNNVKFTFSDTHLKSVTFSLKNTNQDVIITFY